MYENITKLLCPDLGEDEQITIAKVLKSVGDKVKEGEAVFEVEAKKGNTKIYSLSDGYIKEILVNVGDKLNADDEVALIGDSPKESEKPTSVQAETAQRGKKYSDILIIGGGPGGYVAAIYASQNGKTVTLIEKENLGGTCLNVGCIPTKCFVHSAQVYRSAVTGEKFGTVTKDVKVDMNNILAHKNKVVDQLVGGVEFLMDKNSINVVKGKASFVNDSTVAVGDDMYTAKDIIIATGSKVSPAKIDGLDLNVVMDSTKALSLDTLPRRVTIIGGGVIGMEFAFIYNDLGVDVHVVEYLDRPLTMLDIDVSDEIVKLARKKGIVITTSAKVTKIRESQNGMAVVSYEKDGEEQLSVSDKVLFAIGRVPNMDGLNIEAAGVELNDRGRGIKVDEKMHTSKNHIYAIGDVTNIMQLAHVASHQGIVAVDNIMGRENKINYNAVPNVIFTNPEIASVGLSEKEAESKNIDFKRSEFYFSGNGKAVSEGSAEGFVKVIEDKSTNKIIGGCIIGPDASTLINVLTLAVEKGVTVKDFKNIIFPHPTTGEAIYEAVLGLDLGSING
jgi:dihydrolipoamide dehydrogenase